MASVKLEHIYKVYPNGTKAVNDISLDIKDGEFIVFVGPSGCGKSTTLRMIAGLEDITAGELYINNMIVNDVEPKDRDIAMVFQNYALYPHMTVYENLAFGLKLRHVPNEVIQEKVLEAANILGIKDYLDRKPKAMSGGQRQRVALGRAILRDPKVMLLDEPLSNLDAKLRAQMRTEIAKLHQKLKTTFIYVTHDQVEAMTLGDRVVVMKQGRIKQVDSPKNLYDYPSNKFVAGFIGTPQMNFFDCTLLRKGEKVEVSLKENKEKLVVPYNQLIKVLPDYFDGAHPITMGIRCEHINLVDEAVENSVKVKVSHFEELGSNCLIYGNINLKNDSITSEGSGNITIQVKNVSGIKPGDIIYVKFDMSYAYFFDSKSEETIVPRIPVYNSFEASVRDNQLCFLGSEIRLPKALYRADAEGIELRIPTDGFVFGRPGFKAKVIKTEVIGKQNLVHVSANGRTFFAVCDKPHQEDENVSLGIDFTKISIFVDGKQVVTPVSHSDPFTCTFYNFQTVIAKKSEPEFIQFRKDKIDSATKFMDAKILLENQKYEKAKLDAENMAKTVNKAEETASYNAAKATIISAIKVLDDEEKKSLKLLKKDFNDTKKKIKKQNDYNFAEKRIKEENEYRAFRASNKDKETRSRRLDEYHIFSDNFQTDKENTLATALNGATIDYESKVSQVKSFAKRKKGGLEKELSDKTADFRSKVCPGKYIEKDHKAALKELIREKNAAVSRASLVFFLRFPEDYYTLTTDIISNKLVQGLGTRVFSKEFLVEMPHDAYKIVDKKNSFHVTVKETLDYGSDVYFARVSYKPQGGKETFLLVRVAEPLPEGKQINVEFDIAKSQITETGMNIRLY
jgi:multiple sugar transport system ATP-binding protein